MFSKFSNLFIAAIGVASCLGVSANNAKGDDCLEEIVALHNGGPLDPFARPAYRSEKTVTDEKGKLTHVFDSVVESPLKTISGVRGSAFFSLVVNSDSWNGPSMTGPWTTAPNTFPDDREAALKRTRDMRVAGITRATCHGSVEVEGKSLLKYEFHAKPEPDETQNGMWFAELSTVHIDPDINEVVRWEMTDFESSFAPGINREIHTTTFEYDESISISAP